MMPVDGFTGGVKGNSVPSDLICVNACMIIHCDITVYLQFKIIRQQLLLEANPAAIALSLAVT